MNEKIVKDETFFNGIISGMLLGDSNLKKPGNRIVIGHSIKQKSYVEFKANLLSQNKEYAVNKTLVYNKKSTFGTFKFVEKVVNLKTKKFNNTTLDEKLKTLTPLGLLLWWLDDGSLIVHHKKSGSISRHGYLNTHSFTYPEQIKIQKRLEDFGIFTKIHIDPKSNKHTKKDHFRIYINATNLRLFIDLVRRYIDWLPKSILYKLDMQYVINNNPISKEYVKHYNFTSSGYSRVAIQADAKR